MRYVDIEADFGGEPGSFRQVDLTDGDESLFEISIGSVTARELFAVASALLRNEHPEMGAQEVAGISQRARVLYDGED